MGKITNFTSKESKKKETATYTELNITRNVTFNSSETSTGTLKATNAILENVIEFAIVNLIDVTGDGDFKRVDANGEEYKTVKETFNIKTKNELVTGIYSKTGTFTHGGKFTAKNSNIGNIENFSTVVLEGTTTKMISDFEQTKLITKGIATWDEECSFDIQDDFDLTITATKKLNGSVTMKKGSFAEMICNFQTVVMTDSEVVKIENVSNVTINKGNSVICSYVGTKGKDTLTISKGAVLIIDKIDFSPLIKQPKLFIGFSDITVLHNALAQHNTPSLHAIMTKHIATLPEKDEAFTRLMQVLDHPNHIPSPITTPAHPLNRVGENMGMLRGGNLSVLYGLRQTPFDLPSDTDSILFIEDIAEHPYHIDRMINNLRLSGVLSRIKGLIVGQFSDCKEDPSMMHSIQENIAAAVAEYDYPVCFDFPAGHVDYNLPLLFNYPKTQLIVTAEGAQVTYLPA